MINFAIIIVSLVVSWLKAKFILPTQACCCWVLLLLLLFIALSRAQFRFEVKKRNRACERVC